MENKANPCRRAGVGARQGVKELLGGSGPYLQPRRLERTSPCENPPSLSHKRLPVRVLLCQAARGGSAHLRAGDQAGYFQACRLGGAAGAARSARIESGPAPSPSACKGTLPSLTYCAQLFCGMRKCAWQPVVRGGPSILRLVPRRKWECSLEIPWDFIHSRVGKSSVGLTLSISHSIFLLGWVPSGRNSRLSLGCR